MLKYEAVKVYKGQVDYVILFSGGLDSTSLALLAKKEGRSFVTYYVDYAGNAAEQKASAEVCRYLGIPRVVTLSSFMFPIDDDKNRNFIPGRNAYLAFDAYNFAACVGASEIWMGCLDNPEYSDTTCNFMYTLNDVMEYYSPYIPVRMPLVERLEWGKDEILSFMLREDPGVLQYTYSCYSGKEPCGVCHGCTLRKEAFERAGIEDNCSLEL